jgi:dTDP-4-amino-4,6-dideoxygalactose transaminase
MIPFVDLGAQHRAIRSELDQAVARVLDRTQFVLGAEVEAFEAEFAAYCGVDHGVGLNSGTSALHLALRAAGVGPGDEVITVSYSFVATVAAILQAGATPILVEIDPATKLIDPAAVERAISRRTKAVIPVHLYGHCADMDAIMAIARRRNITVVEDAAQAHGALLGGRRAGSLGHIACFSFYPTKNLGACGEAGAVVTGDAALAAEVRILRDQGQRRKYDHVRVGYNERLDAIQAAILRVKLRRLDEWNAARRVLAAEYRSALEGAVDLVAETPGRTPVYHLFTIFTPRRDALRRHLEAAGIGTGIHYPVPVHLQEGYAHLGYGQGALPITEAACRDTLSLPLYPELSRDDVRTVAGRVGELATAAADVR